MKNLFQISIVIMSIALSGCIRAPNYDGVVTIQTDETAFFVDMTSDNTSKTPETLIQKKDVLIPGYWVRTGRWDYQGYWRPAAKVIVVSRSPVRLDWEQSDNTRTIRMTSMESNGFKVPMTINAHIENDADATKYLRSFRPLTSDSIDFRTLTQKEWGPYVKESARPLEDALNNVVFTKIVDMLDDLFVAVSILDAERASKIFITAIQNGMTVELLNSELESKGIKVKFKEDIPSLTEWAQSTYGISIDSMAAIDGVVYDDDSIQEQINILSTKKMAENTLVQEAINIRKQQEIDLSTAQNATRIARERVTQADALRVLQEIDNQKLLVEAEADAMRAGKFKPVPSTVVVQSLEAYTAVTR